MPPPTPSPQVAAILRPPRRDLYLLAHAVLPRLLFQDPLAMLRAFATDTQANAEMAARHAYVVAQVRKESGREPETPNPVFRYERHALGPDWFVLVIHFPPALARVEARYVIGVIHAPKNAGVQHVQGVRVLTLELSSTQDEQHVTNAICEWFADGTRANYGTSLGYIECPAYPSPERTIAFAAHRSGKGIGPPPSLSLLPEVVAAMARRNGKSST